MRVDTFCKLFDELRASPYVEVQTINDNIDVFDDDLNEMIRDEVRRKTGIELSDALMACLNVSDSAGAYWAYQIDENLRGGGEFKLQSLREVFLYETDPLWSEETPPEEVEFLKKLRYIDYHPGAGDDKFAAFAVDKGVMPPPIWYYDRGDCYLMDIDYEGYLEALIITKGITDWQYLFCDVDLNEPLHKGLDIQLRKNLEALAIMFPEHDYSTYYARC